MPSNAEILIIDGEQTHLDRLADGIAHFNVPYLSLRFTGRYSDVPECPNVRMIFSDLHLVGGIPVDHEKGFSVMGGLIEKRIKPTGPYLVLLWTHYPDQAPNLRDFLGRLENALPPIDVLALDKADFLGENGKDLVEAIRSSAKGWINRDDISSLRGSWSPLSDEDVESLMEEIYASRRRNPGRAVDIKD